MNESNYHTACEVLFNRIEEWLEDTNADFNNNNGVLEIEPETGGKIIVSRQMPTREVWIAAKSGGYHFALKDGEWVDNKDGRDIFSHLGKALNL